MLGGRVACGGEAGLCGSRAGRRRAFSAGVVRGVAASLLGTSGCGRLCPGAGRIGAGGVGAGGVGTLTASFVLHGFLRGSKGSVPDCPLRSIPIHSAGGARYACGLPSLCLHAGSACPLAHSPARIGANRCERLGRSRLAMEEEPIHSSRVLTCESSLASPHAPRHADVATRWGKALSLRLPAQRQGKFPNFPPDVQITSGLGRFVPCRTSFKRSHAP